MRTYELKPHARGLLLIALDEATERLQALAADMAKVAHTGRDIDSLEFLDMRARAVLECAAQCQDLRAAVTASRSIVFNDLGPLQMEPVLAQALTESGSVPRGTL